MPPDFDLNRTNIDSFRQNRFETEVKLKENDLNLRSMETEYQTRLKNGAGLEEVANLNTDINRLRQERLELLTSFDAIDNQLNVFIDDVIKPLPLEELFGELDGQVPLVLLPARIETRFMNNATELWIRIFPDAIHLDKHIPELTPQENALGQWYWKTRLSGEGHAAAWTGMTKRVDPPRAAYIVQSLTPTNLQADGSAPIGVDLVFPEVAARANNSIPTPRASVLPDRWVAIGLKKWGESGSYQEIFRKWGNTIPDSLNFGPSFERLTQISEDQNELPVDANMRWMTNYDEAVNRGMAITIRDFENLSGVNRLQDGVDLLMILGIDWTLRPEQAAANVAKLLNSQQHADGLAFIPQGTPTNNTSSRSSGFTTEKQALAAQFDPAQTPVIDPVHSASVRLNAALGLPDGVVDLNRSINADLTEQHTTSMMIDALWQSTGGYYLDVILDPFATDEMMRLARDHAVNYLQPFGPYTTLRVGKQPYGILPVIARNAFKPDREHGVEYALDRTFKSMEWFWWDGVSQVPYMPNPRNPQHDIDVELLKILQMTPISSSLNYRYVYDSEVKGNVDPSQFPANRIIQSDILRSFVLPQFASYTGPMLNVAMITRLWTDPTTRALPLAWVQTAPLEDGAMLQQDYLTEIAQLVRSGPDGKNGLNAKSRSTFALLEMLLALAAMYETGQTVNHVVNGHFIEANPDLQTKIDKTVSLRTSALLGIYPLVEQTDVNTVNVQTPEQMSSLVIPKLTGTKTVHSYIADMLANSPEKSEVHNLASFLESVEGLALRPAAELDRSFRAVLDCYSYRYDAWVTSLASRRLNAVRAKRPTGLHIGGYGWVENLKPDPKTQPDSLGYVHTPSLNHAAAAAILRSGYLSHKDDKSAALNIDLSSNRVRLGLSLLEGVDQGQPLAALLGYRFERGLRDMGINFARFILPFRKLAPYRSGVPEVTTATNENIAARDVVDGIALLELWRKEGKGISSGLKLEPQHMPNPAEVNSIDAELQRLDGMLDAVSDLLTSEALFQTVKGNYERAGAALSTIDRQTRPPELQFIRTPRSGMMYMQRAMLVLQDSVVPEVWRGIPDDPRASVEPRLNAWIARLLGDPQQYRLAARVIRQDKDEAGGWHNTPVGDPLPTVDLLELGLSPLTLVMTSVSAQAQQPSELELRLAHVFAAKIVDPQPNYALELLTEPSDESGMPGFGALRVLLHMIHSFVAKRRAIDARDFYPPTGEPAMGYDLDDLDARLTGFAIPLYKALLSNLSAAVASPTIENLLAALANAAELAVSDAVPDIMLGIVDAQPFLLAQTERVFHTVEATMKKLGDAMGAFKSPSQDDTTYTLIVSEHYIQCLRIIFGENFPVLPRFMPANISELSASRADQSALLDGDSFAPMTWLSQMSVVRPELDKIASVLTAADMLGQGLTPDDYSVMQLPHVAGQRWVGLPEAKDRPLLCLVTIGNYTLDAPVAGLACDGWSEIIPSDSETTGLTFHYDAPAARPPQAIILAVPPDLEQPRWSFEKLFSTVMDTWNLMHIRAVGPDKYAAIGGGILPALYLPHDKTFQVPSVDFEHFKKTIAADTAISSILGKNS